MLNTPFVVIDWFIALAICAWYVFSGLPVGNAYAVLGLIAPAALFMILFFVKQTKLGDVIPFPFKTMNIWASSFLFGVGFLMFFAGGLIKLTQYFLSPYALYTQKAFASYVAAGSVQAQFINIGVIPPIVEEAFWLTMTLVGFLLVYAFLSGYGRDTKSIGSKILMWLGGIALAVGTFAAFHKFNPAYKNLQQFLSAAVFRLMVVVVGFGFSVMEFFLGAHMGNNMSSIITGSSQGAEIFLRAILTTPFGIAFFLYLILRIGIAIYGAWNKKIDYGGLLSRN